MLIKIVGFSKGEVQTGFIMGSCLTRDTRQTAEEEPEFSCLECIISNLLL